MWSLLVVQSEQHVIHRLMAGGGPGRPKLSLKKLAVIGSS